MNCRCNVIIRLALQDKEFDEEEFEEFWEEHTGGGADTDACRRPAEARSARLQARRRGASPARASILRECDSNQCQRPARISPGAA